MSPQVFQNDVDRRLGLGHACDVRGEEDARIAPERVTLRKRLGISDVQNRRRDLTFVERGQERVQVEVAAPRRVHQSCAPGQATEELCTEDAASVVRLSAGAWFISA